MTRNWRGQLLAKTVLAGVGSLAVVGGLAAMPTASAQSAPQTVTPPAKAGEDVVVVTGSLISRPGIETVSPVTVVDQENMDVRGINTVQDAIQQLAANNGSPVTNGWSANGNFAQGASGVSLRALTTNSTLVLFDGLRAAYYPLADDGSRNFVDLNTIPDDIVDHVEVLREGASSLYGADAIAGVVNIITKKNFQGLSVRVEQGQSSRTDAAQNRQSILAGVGDFDKDGFNAYVSAFHYKSDALWNRDRPYPFNTADNSGICFEGTCGANGIVNQNTNGTFALSTAGNFMVRPYTLANPNDPFSAITPVAGGRWQNSNTQCGPGSLVALTAAQQGTLNPSQVCAVDYVNSYDQINPNVERAGVSGRATAKVGDNAEAYFEANFTQAQVDSLARPQAFAANANTGIIYPRFSTSTQFNGSNAVGSFVLNLPVFVCPERVNCATSANRRLNPNNPFAAAGQVARVIGRDLNTQPYQETRNRSYRVAGGIKGTFMNDWSYNVDMTAHHLDLRRFSDGYLHIQHLLDVIADGTYNFTNPGATPQSVIDYLTPPNDVTSTSDQVQLQGSVTIPLMQLAGGPLDLAVGASARYEAVDGKSFNSDANGPTQRYFTFNAFGTSGDRRIYSEFFELNAPVLDNLTFNVAGRYDDYSSGQSNFSPKVGVVYSPLEMLTLRGSYSEGFRIPSFGESNALPTTGFVTNNASLFNNTYLAQYGCTVATFSACPIYIRGGSFGSTTLATASLKAEKSKSINLGFVIEPIKGVSFSVDYYDIEKSDAITTLPSGPALQAYYSGAAIPTGYTVIADAPDPNNPTAKPRVAFVGSNRINADTIKTRGYDFQFSVDRDLTSSLSVRSTLDFSYIDLLETVLADGTVERFDGTLGNFDLTAGSGTPKTHGSWSNTLIWGKYDVTGTLNMFGGYDLSATDQGTGYKDCGLSDGSTPCKVDNYYTFDLSARAKVTDNVTLYGSVLNLFDEMPPIDVITYGGNNYNPVTGGALLGRYFKVGVKLDY